MRYIINRELSKSAYIQLYEQLREDIVGGAFPYGTKLPSKRILAEECGISVITAEHALTLLWEEGYIEPRERSGYFVIFTSSEQFNPPAVSTPLSRRHIESDPAAQHFPFSVMAKTMRRVLSEWGEEVMTKSPNSGVEELRRAISLYLARNRGIHAEPSQIIIGSGAEYLYGLIVATLGRERIWAIEKPSYEKIEKVYKSDGITYEMLPLGSDGITSAALKESSASVLHITPYRSFPSGITASASKRREYIRWVNSADRYIVEDDYESEFTLSKKIEETVFSLSKGERVIYLNTFSKTISPSLRVGYMVLPKELLGEFERKAGFFSCTVPAFEQYVLAELISDGSFERHLNRVRRNMRKKNTR